MMRAPSFPKDRAWPLPLPDEARTAWMARIRPPLPRDGTPEIEPQLSGRIRKRGSNDRGTRSNTHDAKGRG